MPHLAAALSVLATLVPLAAPAPADASSGATVSYAFPTTDQGGIAASAAGGYAVCGGGLAGAGCRTPGALEASTSAGAAIPAGGGADLLFTAPSGTSIAGGTVKVRYHVSTPGVHLRLLYRTASGAWGATSLPDHAVWTTVTAAIPAGAVAAGPSLYARSAVAAGTIAARGADAIHVAVLQVALVDAVAPTVALGSGQIGTERWLRGDVCSAVSASDRGLGVQHVVLDVDGTEAALVAAASTVRPRPRPLALAGQLCLDTTLVHDGYLTGAVLAQDGVDESGNRSLPVLVTLRVDNTAPAVSLDAPDTTEEQTPPLSLVATDPTSGVARVDATIDGAPLTVSGGGPFLLAAPTPLAYGSHQVAWSVADDAGNVTTGVRTLVVVDRTPPTISGATPADGASAEPGAEVGFTYADAGIGVARTGISVALDGGDIDAAGTVSDGAFGYVPPRPLAAGPHRVVVAVTDRAGNEARVGWAFHVATAVEAPAYALVAPRVVRIVAGRPRTVRVVVRLGADPAAGVAIAARWAGGPTLAGATTDADGAGSIILDGSRTGRLELHVGDVATSVRVVLNRGITLTVSGGRACAGCAVTLSGQVRPRVAHVGIEAYHGGAWRLIRSLATSAGGRFRTRLVLGGPGLYVLRATTGAMRSVPVQVYVHAG